MLRTFGRRTFDFGRQVAVMAVVNRTPDSFYDRGATFALDAAVAAAERALAEGADWLDVGGVKAGPGAHVSEREELDRVLPVVEAMRPRRASTSGTTRSSSSASVTGGPGPPLTPPTSSQSAPSARARSPASRAVPNP